MVVLIWVGTYTALSKHYTTYIYYGAEERNRTVDLFITNELLYQLSYFGNLAYKSVNKILKKFEYNFKASLTALGKPKLSGVL